MTAWARDAAEVIARHWPAGAAGHGMPAFVSDDQRETLVTNLASIIMLHAPTWQPIEEAPRDRRPVVVALIRDGKIWRVSDALFNGLGWYTVTGGHACPWATHYLPMSPVR